MHYHIGKYINYAITYSICFIMGTLWLSAVLTMAYGAYRQYKEDKDKQKNKQAHEAYIRDIEERIRQAYTFEQKMTIIKEIQKGEK